jgi:TRAP-type C4-dicarboxylate transport system permease small subunit
MQLNKNGKRISYGILVVAFGLLLLRLTEKQIEKYRRRQK